MTRTKSMFLALVAVFLLPMTANAVPMRVDASSIIPGLGNFYIIFDDTGDGLLQWDEILVFSGLDATGIGFLFYDEIIGIATVAGISQFSFEPGLGLLDDWWFRDSGSGSTARCGGALLCWEFALSMGVTRVPEPGTVALLGIGLLGIGLARRRKLI